MRPSTRRELLAGVLGATLLPLRALANAPYRADPDFSKLQEVDPYAVGVRPHRLGGVRLELEDAPLAGRQLIHDYGHGGAGMTLAFGCASVVGDLAAQAMARLDPQTPPRIAVVGTGVAGLTAASELRRRWPAIPLTVYAKTLDLRKTTSWVAGGQFEPSGIWREYQDPVRKELFASYLRRSRDRIRALEVAGLASAHGIAERDNFTLDHETRSLEDFTPPDVVAPYRSGPLPFERLHVVGRHYRTWLVNPRILLPRLVADLRAAGVGFEERTLAGRADLAKLPANVVINCTGLGAREVVADTALVPQRGHLVLLKKTSEAQDWFFSGGCGIGVISYVFCRQDDIVVGGSLFANRDATGITDEDPPVFAQILENGRQLFAGRPEACRL